MGLHSSKVIGKKGVCQNLTLFTSKADAKNFLRKIEFISLYEEFLIQMLSKIHKGKITARIVPKRNPGMGGL